MTDIEDEGGPAFPVTTEQYEYGHEHAIPKQVAPGMSLRDYFAAKALQELLSLCHDDTRVNTTYAEHCAIRAYEVADAMLKARTA